MPRRRLTLMAVHAHPDDEASSTGGVLARYAAEGVRTVVVTCTDGRWGDGFGGVKPGKPGHNAAEVIRMRRGELANSCAILGVSVSEFLGYADSGMAGWAANDAPGAFWASSVDAAADRLAALMRRHRPDVVVTYDENGFYGHPDHIQTHRVTMAAVGRLGPAEAPAKVYWSTIPHATMEEFVQRMRERGVDWGAGWRLPSGDRLRVGLPAEEITTWVDVRDFAAHKYRALAAHASQPDNTNFGKLDLATFTALLGTETFLRVQDTTRSVTPEADLFAGLD